LTDRIRWHSRWALAVALAAPLLLAQPASADVTLVDKDGWQVFMNGRIQTFANYNEGEGRPAAGSTCTCTDANGMSPELRGGGVVSGDDVYPEFKIGTQATPTDQGLVREMRIRSGFTGNVLGFGIKKRLSEKTELLGYTAVTVGIDSEARRKFNPVRPDWRESFVRATSSWGSLTAGRTLTLFSRGATEITYLYGYRYGLGFPGAVSTFSQSTAGSVGFGVLGAGFGSALIYATPVLGGLQISVGAFDATSIPQQTLLNRGRWPQVQSEITFERNFASSGLVKLFVNGAWQNYYDIEGRPMSTAAYGSGFGGRIELGPVHLGLAGHVGKGVGVTYSFEPNTSLYFAEAAQHELADPASACSMGAMTGDYSACPAVKMRTVDGGYAQLQIALGKKAAWNAGAGVTRVHQLPEDQSTANDSWKQAGTNSVPYITIRQQIGAGTGFWYHVDDNFHVALEYFHAEFQWYKPVPTPANASFPKQTLDFVNAGVTYDF
jgi:hypothetical protein